MRQQHQRYHQGTVAQSILHHYGDQGEDNQHGHVAGGVAEQGHGKVLALEVPEVEEGLHAAHLQHNKQAGQGQAQYVHRDVVSQGVRSGEGFGAFVKMGTGQDESSQHRDQHRRRQVVDLGLDPFATGLCPLVTLVLEYGKGEPDGNHSHHQGRHVNQPPADVFQEQAEEQQSYQGAETGSGYGNGESPASLVGCVHQGNNGVGVGNDEGAAETAQAAPQNKLPQSLGGGGQQIGHGENADSNEEDTDMAEPLPQPGGQKHGAAQHQQADDHRPGGVIHIHAKVVPHRGSGQGYGEEGELDQKLGSGEGQQGFYALGAASQLAKGGHNIKPVKNYG